ncbi:Ima1 N-terminal domain-containing protein [Lipomyces japonicus]|uniref:Ima1 N-terminal domain-containing protein n=1 Tax=Lipomyces japonicus TaxID=56871 RepID=UPI0034CEF20B
MAWTWFLSRPLDGDRKSKLVCFYCNNLSIASKNYNLKSKFYEWICPLCDALNVIDDNGEVQDYVPEDDQLNQLSIGVQAATAPDDEKDSPFCSNCQRNHMIVTQAIANYLPSESDSSYNFRLSQLPAYKNELERRYPLYCDNCRHVVLEKLTQNNYQAKTKILGSFLHKRNLSTVSGSDDSSRLIAPVWTISTYIKTIIWIARGLLLWTYWISNVLLFVFNILYSDQLLLRHALVKSTNSLTIFSVLVNIYASSLKSVLSRNLGVNQETHVELAIQLFFLIQKLAPFSVFYVFWNYQWLRAISSNVSVKIIGKSDYARIQGFLFLIILYSTYALPKFYEWSFSQLAFKLSNLFLLSTLCLGFSVSLTCLRIIPLAQTIEPKSDLVHLLTQQDNHGGSNVIDISTLSVGHSTTTVTSSAVNPRQYNENHEDKMDWNPASGSSFQSSFGDEWLHSDPGAASLPGIPSFPQGVELPPPPRSAVTRIPFSQAVKVPGLSKPGIERHFQHRNRNQQSDITASLTTCTSLSADVNLSPQKFFPRYKPTGLEDIFDPVLKLSDDSDSASVAAAASSGLSSGNMFMHATWSSGLNFFSGSANDSSGSNSFGWIAACVLVSGFLVSVVYFYIIFFRPRLSDYYQIGTGIVGL